ncbi:MAG: hypothetical protein KJ749_02075 [Planctomycetes bacterium]|nr:hypothetical protein [Planctomycetota bacterium]
MAYLRFMRRAALAPAVVLLMAGVVVAQPQADVVLVTVTGEGMTEDEACRNALRKALEQGGQVEIASRSQVENFELIRDAVFARADGIVTDYKIIRKGDAAGGVKFCEIQAKVSKSAIASSWGEVQNLLEQVDRPGIAVYILERIDGVEQDSSILESNIENRLVNMGFDVYAGEHLRVKAQKESADAAAEGDMDKVQAIAKDFGAEIFITGSAQANAAGVRDLYGQETAMYNCDATIKMYYTDTGQLVASEPLPVTRGGARGYFTHSPQAGKKALDTAGKQIVENCYQNVMRQWATRISSGGQVSLEIKGMSMAEALRLKKKIEDIDPDRIVSVNGPRVTKGIAVFRIKAKMTATDLAVYLTEGDWAEIIEVTDLKSNRIEAKKVGP